MRKRLIALSISAFMAVGGLSACTPEAGLPGGPVTTASNPGTPSNPHFTDSVEMSSFFDDLRAANDDISYFSEIEATADTEDGEVNGHTTIEFETVDGVEHVHSVSVIDGNTVETIAIGERAWNKQDGEWVAVPDGAVQMGNSPNSVDVMQEAAESVSYEGSTAEGHEFYIETLTNDVEELAIVVDNDFRLKTIESEVDVMEDTTVTSIEKRSKFGEEFGIKAPL